MVDRLADHGERRRLERDHNQGLRVCARGLAQGGKEAGLIAVHRDVLDGTVPGCFESTGKASPPSVVDKQQADIVEALLTRDAGEDGPLGNVGKRGSKQEIAVGDSSQFRRRGREADRGDTGWADHPCRDRQRTGAGIGADDGMHALDLDEMPCRCDRLLRVRRGVADRGGYGQAEHAAACVDMLDREFERPLPVSPDLG